ncbi:PrsW family intramembrane metalloprotease [Pseudactinotalea sp. HY160]|uniref:PrsW family intramembrane metalloprotease n=1 Tax=Pseudactinotalea sp. HY160 TaxID=2654490 RepID=UPI00128E25F2|nr:PrsW family intramembrane metalloprotease [Pseudactinotalea sp. HY160]MPV49374.1 PrsW family intramembrane metalloprotease [Pseudactinotalea sp. HY160]
MAAAAAQPRRSPVPVVGTIAIVAGLIGVVVVLGIVWSETSAASTFVAFLAALVPLSVVMAAVLWLDRWEPEPRRLLLLTFLWGAGVSTASALGINTFLARAIHSASGDPGVTQLLAAVAVAPVVEETLKGAGLLGLFLLSRRLFDGAVDGVVYAATIAAGFAFTENVLYFARGEMAAALGQVFFARAVVSPFAHIIFTTCMGLAIGLASVRARRVTVALLVFPLGWLAAVGLHALWNVTSFLGEAFLLGYLVLQVPIFLAFLALGLWLRRQERRMLAARLGDYLQQGWFAPHEVAMLTSLRRRADALRWAGRYGVRAKDAMAQFQRNATRIALLRNRAVHGRAPADMEARERRLLASLSENRRAFAAAFAR